MGCGFGTDWSSMILQSSSPCATFYELLQITMTYCPFLMNTPSHLQGTLAGSQLQPQGVVYLSTPSPSLYAIVTQSPLLFAPQQQQQLHYAQHQSMMFRILQKIDFGSNPILLRSTLRSDCL